MRPAPMAAVISSAFLFVYGSLKRGEVNFSLMHQAGAVFVDEGVTEELFPLERGPEWLRLTDRPGVGNRVAGELFRIDSEEGWKLLDDFEGHPHGYRRRLINVVGSAHGLRHAWAYFYVLSDSRLSE